MHAASSGRESLITQSCKHLIWRDRRRFTEFWDNGRRGVVSGAHCCMSNAHSCRLRLVRVALQSRPRGPRAMSTESQAPARPVPAGFKPHTESSTTILVPKGNTAFLNPVQQYNRDLSIAVIRAWNEMRKEEAVARHEAKMSRKGKKPKAKDVEGDSEQPEAGPSKPVRVL